jgi:hypothetical protein
MPARIVSTWIGGSGLMPNPKGCRGEMARAMTGKGMVEEALKSYATANHAIAKLGKEGKGMTGKGMVEEALKSYATANHAIAKLGKEGKGMTGKGMVEEALKSYATANHAIANFGKEGNGMTGNSPGWAGMRCRCRVRWRNGPGFYGNGSAGEIKRWESRATLPSPNSKAFVVEFEDSFQCLMTTTSRPEAKGRIVKQRFKDRVQQAASNLLRDPVANRGDTQRTELARSLGRNFRRSAKGMEEPSFNFRSTAWRWFDSG